MDLLWFASFLNSTLKEIHPESHYKFNYSKNVTYPYIVYSFEHEKVDDIRNEFEVRLNLFDTGTSNLKLLQLENKLSNELHKNYQVLDKGFVYIRTGRSLDVPTGNEMIQRKELNFTIKVDWNIQEEHING